MRDPNDRIATITTCIRTEQLLDEMDARREFRTSVANLSSCLRIAGALASAWNRGQRNGVSWAMGRQVRHPFGPPRVETEGK